MRLTERRVSEMQRSGQCYALTILLPVNLLKLSQGFALASVLTLLIESPLSRLSTGFRQGRIVGQIHSML